MSCLIDLHPSCSLLAWSYGSFLKYVRTFDVHPLYRKKPDICDVRCRLDGAGVKSFLNAKICSLFLEIRKVFVLTNTWFIIMLDINGAYNDLLVGQPAPLIRSVDQVDNHTWFKCTAYVIDQIELSLPKLRSMTSANLRASVIMRAGFSKRWGRVVCWGVEW